MNARDRIKHQMVPNNLIRRLNAEKLERIDRRDAELELAQLADVGVGDAGPLNNGLNIRGDDITVDTSTSPATFTGTGEVECWPALEVYAGIYAVNFLLKNGVVTYYKSTDGSWYAGAGTVKIDDDGIRLINVGDVSRFIFNDPLLTASGGDIGSIGQAHGDRLWVEFDPYGSAELLSNQGFEAGALTNWTAAGAGTWSAQTTTVYRGNYAARCLLSGTSAHTLTSDRIALASFELALLVFYRYDTLSGWTEKTAYIKWYDNTVGGNLLQTDSVDLGNAGANSWRYKFLRIVGPGNAVSCEVILSATASSGTPSIYFDALRLRAAGQYGSLEIRGTLKGAIPNGPYLVGAPPANSFFGPDVLPYWISASNQTMPLQMGAWSRSFQNAISTTAYTMWLQTLMANSLGPNGQVVTEVDGTTFNNSAGNRVYTFTHNFGAYTFGINTTGQGASATNRSLFEFKIKTYNDQAQNSQVHIYSLVRRASAAATAGAVTDDLWAWDTSAITTSSDVTQSATITSASSATTQTVTGIARQFGPVYGGTPG